MITQRRGVTAESAIVAVEGDGRRDVTDDLAVEEPFEIRLRAGGVTKSLAITMRTPGNDFELAAGFLFSEGIVTHRETIAEMSYCLDSQIEPEQRYNIVTVDLTGNLPELDRLERHFVVNSSCGVCGKASIDALAARAKPLESDVRIPASVITALPDRMRAAQRAFASTGGLHAAALFNSQGELLALREDVGRHNALDKIAGWALLNGRMPLHDCILLVSGRASYELLQKTVTAGIPVFCSISAPSSLAVDTALAFNVTLCGFVRGEKFNIYSGAGRVAL